jgi:hypothetical protein
MTVRSPSRLRPLLALLLFAACAARREHTGVAPAARPAPVTVPKLQTMLDEGEAIDVIISSMESSGTIYRLATAERDALRSEGMPAAILSFMQESYERAIRRHPELARSNDRWIKVGDYWYGGLPAGWPHDWVSGP